MPTDLRISIHIGVRDGARAAYPVQLQQEGKPLADVWAPIDLQSLLEHEHAASARDYGMVLYDTLFAGAIGRAYQRLQGQAGGEGSIRVQLVIHPNAPELHALAWERLFQVFGDEEAPLAANAQTPFSRFLTSGAGDQDPIADHPLRLLIAVANPLDLPQSLAPIDVVGEVAALADALGDRRGRLRVTLVPGVTGLPQELRLRITQELGWTIADGVASWQAIQSQLPNQHLVHILAHGHRKQGEHPG